MPILPLVHRRSDIKGVLPLEMLFPGGAVANVYLLDDEFLDTLAGGAVNGTDATPGPGTRVVTDTGSKESIATGKMVWGSSTANWNPDHGYTPNFIRTAGRMCISNWLYGGGRAQFGLTASATPGLNRRAMFDLGVSRLVHGNSVEILGAYTAVVDTLYKCVIVLRASGSYYFIKGGAFSSWTLLWYSSGLSTSPLWIHVTAIGNTSDQDTDFIRIPDDLYLPIPLAYDTFTRANGVIGSTEATGPEGQATPSKVWTGATWTVAGNEVVNTPGLGAELLLNPSFANWTGGSPDNWAVLGDSPPATEVTEVGSGAGHGGGGNGAANMFRSDASGMEMRQTILTVGNWYRVEANCSLRNGGGILVTIGNATAFLINASGAYLGTGRASATPARFITQSAVDDVTIDNASYKLITLAALFASLTNTTPDVVASIELDTVVANTQAGMVLNLDDAATPANFVVAYHNGTNAILEKCVAGVYTGVISAAAAYGAGRTLVVIKEGTAYRLYYNNVQIGATSTVSDAGIVDNTLHGMFSTYDGNQLDNFQLMPRGTSEEYSDLDQWSGVDP